MKIVWRRLYAAVSLSVALAAAPADAQDSLSLTVAWDKVERVSQTTATLQVVVNPPLRRSSPIHDREFQALRDLQCDYVRYVPWLPYPRLVVAELEPPEDGKTSWDFSLIDPLTTDFLDATAGQGHSVILNFSTIPQWMYKTPKPVPYPADPDQVTWNYEQGTELRDPTLKEVSSYYARLVSWYTQGGFKDELGQKHTSGHQHKIDYWEVLNEVDFEHGMTPQSYTRIYDAIAKAVHQADPQVKFVGMALASPSTAPQFFEYFLNSKNHDTGVPLDMISYHFYATPLPEESPEIWQYAFFDQADRFLTTARYVEAIRTRLAPETRTDIDEVGCILPFDTEAHLVRPIPNAYWNLCGALFAHLYVELARLGIDVVGESQLVGYPTQFPSVSMVDWETGQPNARYWVLKLLGDNFGAGDRLVETQLASSDVTAQAFVTRDGRRKVLLVNKRNRPTTFTLRGAAGGEEEYVGQETGSHGVGKARLSGASITLGSFEVAVVTLPES
jgi:glycosyl hydrolase family 39 (putative alpha-L-iduronidase)